MSPEPCPHCKRPDNPAITNWVTGHVFVGWGIGWQRCRFCGGSALHPKYEEAINWLVATLKQIVPLAAAAQPYRSAIEEYFTKIWEVDHARLACNADDPDLCTSSRCREKRRTADDAVEDARLVLGKLVVRS